MNILDLERILQLGESETQEFKKTTAMLTATGQTLCGFLNFKGGKVFIGIYADKLIGQQVSDSTLIEISALIKKFEPPPIIDLERVQVKDGKEIIVLSANSRKNDIPYTFEGRPYQRVGSTTSIMPQQTYQRLLLERNHNNHRWETELAIEYDLENLDAGEIFRTLRLGINAGRLPEYQGEDSLTAILDRMGLRKNGCLINAAIVLFGKKFLPDFTQCQLRLARFKGVDKSEFIDQNQLTGNAFYLLEEAMLFLRRHLPIAGKILPGILERQDEPLFPPTTLREALVNAFCHRTYTHPGGAVSVAIFDDRLEIWNDGTLPFELTPADLKKDHASLQRNPVIASVFYNRGLIERW